MNNEKNQRIREKLEFFLVEKVTIHIIKTDRRFMNGTLIEKKSDNIFIFKDNKFGLVHLFVSDVYDVSEYQESGR